MNQFIEGFLLQASLILALGAQNIFVLESGLKKKSQFLVAAVCSLCDLTLIIVGVLGAASIFVQVPILKNCFGIIGVFFLFFYGVKKIYNSFQKHSTEKSKGNATISTKKIILLTLGFSLLNPHVYLDTIVLIGGYAAKFPKLQERVHFGAGASAFSVLWFYGLALFARLMSRFLNNSKSMKIISFISGVILLILALKLGSDVFVWVS
jgi:L-lysine exporter family protein LysE/ArgO